MKKQITLLCAGLFLFFGTVMAQLTEETLDRGVVAVRSGGSEVFISWRLLETDPVGIGFNIYRSADGGAAVKLNSSILSTLTGGTNYTDYTADISKAAEYKYYVKPVINGVEQTNMKSDGRGLNAPADGQFSLKAAAADPCVVVPIKSGVLIHFVWVGDLDGNGTLDYVVDRLDWTNGGCKIEAYKSDGTYLWTVDFGPNSKNMDNISPGSATIDVGMWDGVTVSDVNGDGKAEVIIKIANGVKFGDGTTWTNSSNTKQWIGVLNGTTGALLKYCAIPTDYLSVGPMGCQLGVGNCGIIAFMKNRNADKSFNMMTCCFQMGSGLTLKWKKLGGGADGHAMRIVDLNGDGTDDVAQIGFALNGTNGSVLYDLGSQGIVHGDRFMIGKFDRNRSGLQGYGIQQSNPSGLREYYYDASTGTVLWKNIGAVADMARGDAGDIDPRYGGYEVWSFDGVVNGPSHTQITAAGVEPYPVLRLWWDGDDLSESYNDGKIEKWNYSTSTTSRLVTTWNYNTATSSDRGAPMFYGDIMGDWREECILTSSDYSKLIIFTTNIATSISRASLRSDRYYKNDLTVKGYMQSHYTSYYIGDQSKSSQPEDNVVQQKGTVIISPNPLSGSSANITFTLQNESNAKIEVYDLTGKLILSKNLGVKNSGKTIETLDLSSLAKGCFIIKLITSESNTSTKFIRL